MFAPYFYCYIISSILVYSIFDIIKVINPANPNIIPTMGNVGFITKIANIIYLILCFFFAKHWWYVPLMWIAGIIFSVAIKNRTNYKVYMFLGYIAVLGAPLCTLFAYLNLFGKI